MNMQALMKLSARSMSGLMSSCMVSARSLSFLAAFLILSMVGRHGSAIFSPPGICDSLNLIAFPFFLPIFSVLGLEGWVFPDLVLDIPLGLVVVEARCKCSFACQ